MAEWVRRPELQYALRSWMQVPHNRVWFVGGKPDWVTNVEHVPFKDGADKWDGISRKARSLASIDGLGDWFYYTEDDYFILRPGPIPHYVHPSNLKEMVHQLAVKKVRRNRQGGWAGYLSSTLEVLQDAGIPEPESYDVHIPLLVEKARMPVHLETRYPVSWRSLYGNFSGVPFDVVRTDVKSHHSVKRKAAVETGFLSSAEGSFRKSGIETLLQSRFPEPSIYEKE